MLDWLFNGSPPKNATSATVSTTTMPDWYQEYLRAMMGQSSAIAAAPYQQYQGARIQDFTPDQQSAFNMVRSNIGVQDPYNLNAANMMADAGNPMLNQTAFNSYMNPYTSGVVDRLGVLGARNLSENLLPQINSTFTGAGQWGSSRNADFTARALRDANESTLAAQNQALSDSYNNAMSNYGQAQNREAYAGQALGALGSQVQGEALKDSAALQGIGQQQQALGQQSLDTAYGDFQKQQDWGKNQARFMNEMVRGVQPPTSTATNASTPGNYNTYSPSPLNQLAGAGIAAVGASKAGLFAEGGLASHKGRKRRGRGPIGKVSKGPRIRKALAKRFHEGL